MSLLQFGESSHLNFLQSFVFRFSQANKNEYLQHSSLVSSLLSPQSSAPLHWKRLVIQCPLTHWNSHSEHTSETANKQVHKFKQDYSFSLSNGGFYRVGSPRYTFSVQLSARSKTLCADVSSFSHRLAANQRKLYNFCSTPLWELIWHLDHLTNTLDHQKSNVVIMGTRPNFFCEHFIRKVALIFAENFRMENW